MEKGRILAIDYGERRVGLALSDPMRIIASGLTTLKVRSDGETVAAIVDLSKQHEVSLIVLGLPLEKSGVSGQKARHVARFRDRLAAAIAVPIVTWDERLTTVAAKKMLLETESRKKRRTKARLDTLAATVILRNYLDHLGLTAQESP